MKHSTAAGQTACKEATFFSEKVGPTFFPCVLILANNNGILILPKEEDASILFHGFHQILLGGKIQIGIKTVTFVQLDPVDHAW